MPLYIKIDITEDGKVYAWQSEDGLKYATSTTFGYSPREVLLKIADKMQRRPKGAA